MARFAAEQLWRPRVGVQQQKEREPAAAQKEVVVLLQTRVARVQAQAVAGDARGHGLAKLCDPHGREQQHALAACWQARRSAPKSAAWQLLRKCACTGLRARGGDAGARLRNPRDALGRVRAAGAAAALHARARAQQLSQCL